MKKVNVVVMVKFVSATLLVLAASILTYYKSTENAFVWDTFSYLYKHPFYLWNLSVDNIIWMFLSLDVANWHPLTWLSWAIDYQMYGGFDHWGYHFTNIVLHAINSALLFVVILVVFGLNRPRHGSYPLRLDNSALVAASLAAILFAVHPQHVESVAWVAERKDLLCQLFMLLSMLAYVRYVSCQEGMKNRWFLTSLSLFFLAVLSKPMAVTFPVVLLLMDVYPLRRSSLCHSPLNAATPQTYYVLLREKLPFFLLSVFLILITLRAQQIAFVEVPLNSRVFNAFNSILLYLGKLVVPLHFSPHYPQFLAPGEDIGWRAFVPVAGVLGISLASLWAWIRGHKAWLIAWLFYLLTLSPVLGLIQVGEQGAADRYAYFPTLPVYVLIGVALLKALERISIARKWALVLVIVPIVFLLAYKTDAQISVWKSPLSLWQHAARYSPGSRLAQFNLGITNLNHDNLKEAAQNFEAAGQLERTPGRALAWRGLVYLKLARYQDAMDVHVQLQARSRSKPELGIDQNCVKYNIAWISTQLGLSENAANLFNAVDPSSKPGSGAMTWLEWLASNPDSKGDRPDKAGLPAYCEALIPSMAVNKWSDMASPAS